MEVKTQENSVERLVGKEEGSGCEKVEQFDGPSKEVPSAEEVS